MPSPRHCSASGRMFAGPYLGQQAQSPCQPHCPQPEQGHLYQGLGTATGDTSKALTKPLHGPALRQGKAETAAWVFPPALKAKCSESPSVSQATFAISFRTSTHAGCTQGMQPTPEHWGAGRLCERRGRKQHSPRLHQHQQWICLSFTISRELGWLLFTAQGQQSPLRASPRQCQ